jgi:hypothetical protein
MSKETSKEVEVDEIRQMFINGGFSDLPDLKATENEEAKPKEGDEENIPESAPQDQEAPVDEKPEDSEAKEDEPEPEDDPLPHKITPLGESDVAKLAAQTAVEAVRQMQEDQKEEPAPEPEPWKDTLKALGKKGQYLAKLEQIKPDKYKDLGRKIHDFKAKEQEYRQKWEEENPGSEFDRNDSEHRDFFRKNEPVVLPDDFEEAKEQVIVEQATARAEEKVRPIIEEQRRRQIETEVAPKVRDQIADIVLSAVSSVDDETKALVEQDRQLATLEEKDPLLAKALQEASTVFVPVIAVAAKVINKVPVDQNDPATQAFTNSWVTMEKEAVQSPPPDRRDPATGAVKKFATVQQFMAMSKKMQDKHFIITPDDVMARLKSEYSSQVKQKTESYRDLVRLAGGSVKSKNTESASSQPTSRSTSGSQTVEKQPVRKSPAVGSRGPAVSASASSSQKGQESGSAVAKFWL